MHWGHKDVLKLLHKYLKTASTWSESNYYHLKRVGRGIFRPSLPLSGEIHPGKGRRGLVEDFPLFGPTVLDDQFHGFLWNFLINTLFNGNSPQNLIYPPVKYIHKIVKVSAREIANIKFLVHSKYVFAFLQYLICFGNQETTSLLAQIHLFLQPLGPNKLTVSPSLPEPINFHLQCFHVNFSRCICPLHDLK